MNIIDEQHSYINEIVSTQKYDSTKRYNKSQFAFIHVYNGKYLAYNTLFCSLYELNEHEYNVLINPIDGDEEILKKLVEKNLLVESTFNEYTLSCQIKSFGELFIKPNGINNYTILTTTDCNARCYYCYEHGIKKIAMSLETAEDIVQYILKNHTKPEVDLKWFGGEPLYNKDVIDYICKRLKENNIDFKSQITSNGYLFDYSTVQSAVKNWNLQKTQITLDGTEKIYNKYKNYIYGNEPSPFIQVTDNIEHLLNAGVQVQIRMNMDANNSDDLYDLINFVLERYKNGRLPMMYVAMIFTPDQKESLEFQVRLIEKWKHLSEHIRSNGMIQYRLRDSRVPIISCMADNDEAVVIAPDGKLCRCEHFSENEVYGSIYSDEIDKVIYDSWKVKLPTIKECESCYFHPGCCILDKCATTTKCTEAERIAKEYKLRVSIEGVYRQYLKMNGDA